MEKSIYEKTARTPSIYKLRHVKFGVTCRESNVKSWK